MKDKLTALVVEGRITVNDLRTIENAFAAVAEQAARIAELEAPLSAFHDEVQGTADQHMLHLLGRVAELEAEVLSWQKCCREGQEMLNTIGRQLGGQIPEQLVSEVAHQRMAEIAELEAASRIKQLQVNDAETRIAELEKQAALDKSLLALADARINRELRDDFAGRAMQGLLARPGGGGYTPTMAYAMADEMLKAKGGA